MTKIKSLEELRRSRVEMTRTAFRKTYNYYIEEDIGPKVLVYNDGGCFISQLPSSEYHLVIDRSEYIDISLAKLEQILWNEFYKYEMGLGVPHNDDFIETHDQLIAYATGLIHVFFSKDREKNHNIISEIQDLMIDCEATLLRTCRDDQQAIVKDVKESIKKLIHEHINKMQP